MTRYAIFPYILVQLMQICALFTLRSKINHYGFNEVNRVYVDRYENIEHFDVGRTINWD